MLFKHKNICLLITILRNIRIGKYKYEFYTFEHLKGK